MPLLDGLTALLVGLGLWSAPEIVVEGRDEALAIEQRNLDQAGLESVVARVLEQVYSAFAEVEEEAIYDGLATVTHGELLTDLYLQRRQAQLYEGGGAGDILSIELFELSAEERGAGYIADAGWRVVGRVGHEGHVHERMNLYDARLQISPIEGQWRLIAFELGDVVREEIPDFVGGE